MGSNINSPVDFESFAKYWQIFAQFFSRLEIIPHDAEDFTARYGSFHDSSAVESMLQNLAELAKVSFELGGPQALEKRLVDSPGWLNGSMSDGDGYSGICWLSFRCAYAAASIVKSYQSLPDMVATGSADERAGRVKQLLAGTEGLVPDAVEIKVASDKLATSLTAVSALLYQAYASFNETSLLNMSNLELGRLTVKINTLEKQVNDAHNKEESAWFGKKKAEKRYQTLRKELDGLMAEQSRKQQLTEDFDGLFSLGNKAVNALLEVISLINKIGDEFTGLRSLWMATAQGGNATQLSDYEWLRNALSVQSTIAELEAMRSNVHAFMPYTQTV